MTLTLTFAWWMVPVALAVLAVAVGLWWAIKADDGSAYNPVPGLIFLGMMLVVIALLCGALFTWLAGR